MTCCRRRTVLSGQAEFFVEYPLIVGPYTVIALASTSRKEPSEVAANVSLKKRGRHSP
jgi:hypothetical protein